MRGYRSAPGAPTVDPLQFGMANLTSGTGGTPMDAWRTFFKSATPAAVPTITAPQLGQTNINPNDTTASLIPESAPDAAGMAGVASRPFAAPKVSGETPGIAPLPSLTDAKPSGGFLSTTRQQALAIGAKYGGKPATFRSTSDMLRETAATRARINGTADRATLGALYKRMDADYESLFPDAFSYADL